jgi:hypothetical protein
VTHPNFRGSIDPHAHALARPVRHDNPNCAGFTGRDFQFDFVTDCNGPRQRAHDSTA